MTASLKDISLADKIRATGKTGEPVTAPLKTNERVLARITDGIYRQPSSALRELISNAYDADASEVTILTDAPRFSVISVRDDGLGLSPEVLAHLIENIGGSTKRTDEGADYNTTDKNNPLLSPGGRQLIGKLGIGLFSVAQFTRHFLIISKRKGDKFRTVADIKLGPVNSEQRLLDLDRSGHGQIERGYAKIWQEPSTDINSQGTEIKLLDLLPRTRDELASLDLWARLDYEIETEGKPFSPEPILHVGRVRKDNNDELLIQPRLPWTQKDKPKKRFEKLVEAVRGLADSNANLVDLTKVCDRYLQTIWTLSLAAPLDYLDGHPFDLTAEDEINYYKLENNSRGQAKELKLKNAETPRKTLDLKTPILRKGDSFSVFFDGVQLFRPITFRSPVESETTIKTPLLFVGHDRQTFAGKPEELTGGPLEFEAYLYWAPKVLPTQHQGVMIRVGNASGQTFDDTFMGYKVSEQTRLRQITAEIYVREGLDGAINIDRESFNYAHPHYQYLLKWLHSAIRQLTNKHKEIGKDLRSNRLIAESKKLKEALAEKVEQVLVDRGVEDVPDIRFLEKDSEQKASTLRRQGVVAYRKEAVLPESKGGRATAVSKQRMAMIEKKTIAIAQILHGWGVLDRLTYENQEKLIRDIAEIMIFGGDT